MVPPDAADYAICTADQMRLGTAAYRVSLVDREALPIGEGNPLSIVVEVPLRNLLTVETLGELLGGVAR
jgi:hypothetical protein